MNLWRFCAFIFFLWGFILFHVIARSEMTKQSTGRYKPLTQMLMTEYHHVDCRVGFKILLAVTKERVPLRRFEKNVAVHVSVFRWFRKLPNFLTSKIAFCCLWQVKKFQRPLNGDRGRFSRYFSLFAVMIFQKMDKKIEV